MHSSYRATATPETSGCVTTHDRAGRARLTSTTRSPGSAPKHSASRRRRFAFGQLVARHEEHVAAPPRDRREVPREPRPTRPPGAADRGAAWRTDRRPPVRDTRAAAAGRTWTSGNPRGCGERGYRPECEGEEGKGRRGCAGGEEGQNNRQSLPNFSNPVRAARGFARCIFLRSRERLSATPAP